MQSPAVLFTDQHHLFIQELPARIKAGLGDIYREAMAMVSGSICLTVLALLLAQYTPPEQCRLLISYANPALTLFVAIATTLACLASAFAGLRPHEFSRWTQQPDVEERAAEIKEQLIEAIKDENIPATKQLAEAFFSLHQLGLTNQSIRGTGHLRKPQYPDDYQHAQAELESRENALRAEISYPDLGRINTAYIAYKEAYRKCTAIIDRSQTSE